MTGTPTCAEVAGHLPPDDRAEADLIVDPMSGGGCFPTLLAAIDAAIRAGGTRRRVIRLIPGDHAGPAHIPPEAPPLTIEGAGATLRAGIDAGMTGADYLARFEPLWDGLCAPLRAPLAQIALSPRIGTGQSAVLTVARDDCILRDLTIRNTYDCDRAWAAPAGAVRDDAGRFTTGEHQAVALEIRDAKGIRLEALQLHSRQDTLYLRGARGRVCLRDCLIEGDLDFVFGAAAAWFETCELRLCGDRVTRGWVLAPSTALEQAHGFVFNRCRFTGDQASQGQHSLGRQWFEGVRASPYARADVRLGQENSATGTITRQTLEAVGKCQLIGCEIGPHIDPATPWDCWGGAPGRDRYRPVQTGPDAFLTTLDSWLSENGLDYRGLAGGAAWLRIA